MKGILGLPLLAASVILCSAAAEPKAPAQFIAAGSSTGGSEAVHAVINGIRFGAGDDFKRLVLDLVQPGPAGQQQPATAHPAYRVEYAAYPYRLIITMTNTSFSLAAPVQARPALPFSVVAEAKGGKLREMQVFLPGPSEFKVIEIDDPAKICIDVRELRGPAVPTVYTVQVTDAATPEQAFALVEAARWPSGFTPQVLVLGSTIVLEQAFTDPAEAARCEDALRAMGYQSVINERRGNELPLR